MGWGVARRLGVRCGLRVFRVLLVLFLVGVAWVGYEVLAPFGPGGETFVEIPVHTSTWGVASRLERGGVVRSRWVFAGLRALASGTPKAGEYRFARPASMWEVYRRLRRGDVYTVAVAIPEGYNLFDVAGAVQAAGLGSRGSFLAAAAANTGLIRQWDPHAVSLEGYLFPDTYRFSRRATPATMLGAMTRRFGQVALRLGLNGPTLPGVVTTASLVEREVHVDAERAVVAGVFENRLRLRMPLQTDPAVVYASMLRGTWTGVIHQSELHSDSPYNTYAHAGLPPGPICNPGVAALRAALHPRRTDFLYFVANPDGSTRFAATLGEHNANVAVYRAGLSQP